MMNISEIRLHSPFVERRDRTPVVTYGPNVVTGVCEGCEFERRLVEHHWPQSISLEEARKLGQTRMLCYWCNRRLAKVFPNIGDVPWETQLADLQWCKEVVEIG